MTEENKEIVNPFDFGYERNQVIGFDGNTILNLMGYIEQVVATQPKIGALLQYPETVNKITDDKGNLVKVDIDWKDHTMDSFFLTASEQNGAVTLMTDIALKGHQLLYILNKIHQSNINNKIAKKIEDLNAESVFKS